MSCCVSSDQVVITPQHAIGKQSVGPLSLLEASNERVRKSTNKTINCFVKSNDNISSNFDKINNEVVRLQSEIGKERRQNRELIASYEMKLSEKNKQNIILFQQLNDIRHATIVPLKASEEKMDAVKAILTATWNDERRQEGKEFIEKLPAITCFYTTEIERQRMVELCQLVETLDKELQLPVKIGSTSISRVQPAAEFETPDDDPTKINEKDEEFIQLLKAENDHLTLEIMRLGVCERKLSAIKTLFSSQTGWARQLVKDTLARPWTRRIHIPERENIAKCYELIEKLEQILYCT